MQNGKIPDKAIQEEVTRGRADQGGMSCYAIYMSVAGDLLEENRRQGRWIRQQEAGKCHVGSMI